MWNELRMTRANYLQCIPQEVEDSKEREKRDLRNLEGQIVVRSGVGSSSTTATHPPPWWDSPKVDVEAGMAAVVRRLAHTVGA